MNFNYKKVMEEYKNQIYLFTKELYKNENDAKKYAESTYAMSYEGIDEFSFEDMEAYSRLNVKAWRKNDAADDDVMLFIDTLNLGAALLLRYDVTQEQYVEWVKLQNPYVRLFLYGLIGLTDKVKEERAQVDHITLNKFVCAKPAEGSFIKIVDNLGDQNSSSKVFPIHGKYVVIDNAVAQDNDLLRFVKKIAGEQTSGFDAQYTKELNNVENLAQNLLGMAAECLFEAVRESLLYMRKNGAKNISEELFIKRFYKDFDYTKYNDTVQNELLNLILNACSANEQAAIKRQMRENPWQGGGFGIAGAIKGAVTAEVMNVGTNVLFSIGNSISDKIRQSLLKKSMERLFADQKVYLVSGLKKCCLGMYNGIKTTLVEQGIHRDMWYTKEQVLSILAAVSKENNLSDRDYLKCLLDCMQYHPHIIDIYTAIYKRFGDKNGELQQIVDFFDLQQEYSKTIQNIDEISKQELSENEWNLQLQQAEEVKKIIDSAIQTSNWEFVWNEIGRGNTYAEYALEKYYRDAYKEYLEKGDVKGMKKLMLNNVPESWMNHTFAKYLRSYLTYDLYLRVWLGGATKDRAVKEIFELANLGNISAIAKQGFWGSQGDNNATKNKADAVKLLEKAADSLHPAGLAWLGSFYRTGEHGLSKDKEKARKLLSLAAAFGHPYGVKELAKLDA